MAVQAEEAVGTRDTQGGLPNALQDTVLRCLATQPLSADLQISAFCSALQHYRHASVATPFPSHLFTTSKGEKDYRACLTALQRLKATPALIAEQLQKAPQATLDLLAWLLLPENRRRNSFTPMHPQQFLQHAASRQAPSSSPPNFNNPAEVPTVILQREQDQAAAPATSAATAAPEGDGKAFSQPVIAYHGTCMENLHSILNTGLLNVSDTRLRRNGAIFGAGIYLSTRFDVAFSFSKPADSWRHSQLGSTARCLLVCEVDMSKVEGGSSDASKVEGGGPVVGAAARSSSPSSSTTNLQPTDGGTGMAGPATSTQAPATGNGKLPESYLLVTRPDAIRLLYVLVYSDAKGSGATSGLSRIPWSFLVVVVYSLWLALQWFLGNRRLRMQLGRWWQQLLAGPEAHTPAWQRWQ